MKCPKIWRLVAFTFTSAGIFLSATAAWAGTYNISVDPVTIDAGNFSKQGVGYNGASPGPILRFNEGEHVKINVTNNLTEPTSIHWHGLIVPYQMDGVPDISFKGIAPGKTFNYEFTIQQSGTYWYHSHSAFQEPDGAYGAIIIKPKKRDPFRYERDYVVQLTDKHPHAGARIMRNLKMMPDYYNRQQQTLGDFFKDIAKQGLGGTIRNRLAWGAMRMTPTDVEDVQGFTALINGKNPERNWTGLFKPGERIRLRFINSSAMSYFDIRIPGLKMTVVSADGNNVQPVSVDEFRIAVAETYDVIVRPTKDQAYTILAESMGRTAMARGTLAPRLGMRAAVPALRQRPLLTMADMGMDDMADMGMGARALGATKAGDSGEMKGGMARKMAHPKTMKMMKMAKTKVMKKKMAKMNHGSMRQGQMRRGMGQKADPFYARGSGILPVAANGGKFLSYADLKALKPLYKQRQVSREIELRLTGNMERYIWTINGKKYSDAEPIRLQLGERVRFKFVNETMMVHPMHLHGMWSILDTGAGKWNPIKHTVSIAPGTTVYTETEVDAVGRWAFHCHLAYHAAAGMFRMVVVEKPTQSSQLKASQ